MTALWTEVCLAFPSLGALRAEYEVFPVVDAVAGTSAEAHRAGLERIVQAGAQPIVCVSLACELQRDWPVPTLSPTSWISFSHHDCSGACGTRGKCH